MFNFKKWFKKKPKEENIFSDNFKKLVKAVVERPKDKPYDDYIKSRILTPTDPLEFVKTLKFDNEYDITLNNINELSKEAKLKIKEIIREDYENERKQKEKLLEQYQSSFSTPPESEQHRNDFVHLSK